MPYQSNPSRPLQESYGDSSADTGELLLPDGRPGINVGASNSALGGGTTTGELVSKLRFLNCGACALVLLFRTLSTLLNPVRLALLVSHPEKLALEALAGLMALALFIVEARVPFLAEKALALTGRLAVGGRRCVDLDAARGRVLVLIIMGISLGMINYLDISPHGGAPSSSAEINEEATSDGTLMLSSNFTDSKNDDAGTHEEKVAASTLLIILRCTIFSPTVLIVIALTVYTLYVLHTFPDYAHSRAYSIEDGTDTVEEAPSSRPSWVSNVGSMVQGGGGYQTVGA